MTCSALAYRYSKTAECLSLEVVKPVSTTSIFDNDQFTEIEPMAMTRWYPTSTTLASGQVLTTLGTTAAPYPELWTDGKGWSLVPEINLQSILDSENVGA